MQHPLKFFECFQELLKHVPKHRELILMPINADNHYSLLAVSGSEVRWYEGLTDPKPSHQQAYKQVLDIMQLELPASRAHVSVQVGAECAFFVLHMAERELRKLVGEHESIVGWPTQQRMTDLRARVSNWASGLETERKRWEAEYNDQLVKHEAQVAKWLHEAEQRAMQKKLSEQATIDAKRLAHEIMHSSASPLDYPVPENFQVALDILEEVKQENAKQAALRRQELRLLRQEEPAKAAELEKAPEQPVGREVLDKQLDSDPQLKPLVAWDWRVELLSPERREEVHKVWARKDPWRVCSRCRWMSGCLSCDAAKCLKHHLVKTGYVGPAMWS